jgi:chemotaxis protein MotB
MAIKAKPRPEKDRSERWLLTYADLITLLMVFFVILYSFSIIDVRKFLSLKGALTEAFNQGALSAASTTGLNTEVSGSAVTEQISAASEASKANLATQLQKIAEATGLGEEITVSKVSAGINLSLSANILFQSGTSDMKPGAAQLLAQLGEPLNDISNPLEVIANTDDLPPASTNSQYKDNWDLGNARSHTVLRTLVDQDKINEARISLGNKSGFSPIVPNDTPENRAKNRRVDVLIVFPRPEDQPIGTPFQIPVQPAVAP